MAEWITPAWAGKSSLSSGRGLRWGGSPPRGRGKGAIQKGGVTHSRITPAWAGKSIVKVPLIIPVQDHPRVGGEKKAGE